MRQTALGEVFSAELAGLDPNFRELVDRIVHYLEKNTFPFLKLAKEVVMDQLDQA